MNHLLDWHLIDDATWQRQVEGALRHHRAGKVWSDVARGRSLALMFFNASLRTRTSMELAAAHFGAHVTTLTAGQGTWQFAFQKGVVMDGGEAEHIQEAVAVLSRYYDAIGVRMFASQTDYEQDRDETLLHTFTSASTVPVVNLESAFYHPCQALADAGTMMTHFREKVARRRFVLSWAYHPKALPMAVPNSAVLMAARLGMDVTVARPAGFALDEGVMRQARAYAEQHGTTVEENEDMDAAFEGAEVIYAKAWGGRQVYSDPEGEAGLRRRHRDWRVTAERMATTRDGIFMHCLPVRRNVVVDDAVLDSPQAIHLLQAEFRLHAQKAILERMWGL